MADTIHREVYTENKLEYGQLLLIPKISEIYPEITKDYALANLDRTELIIVNLRQEIMNILILAPHCFNKSIESFNRDQHCMLQTTRSKFALQSKLERSNLTGETTETKGFEKDKAKTIFGSKGGQ
jgi:hypothetical protein